MKMKTKIQTLQKIGVKLKDHIIYLIYTRK